MKELKKFDICLMNPPYGSTGNDAIHLKFIETCVNICNKQIVVMPFTFVTKLSNKVQNKFKERLSKYIETIEEIDSKTFKDTNMQNVGIYVIDTNKNKEEKIKITYIKGNNEELSSLLDKKNTSDYEDDILSILGKNGQQEMDWCGGHSHTTAISLRKKYHDITNEEIKEKIKEAIINACKHIKKISKDVYLLVNCFNGGMNGKVFTSKNGDIISGYNNLEHTMINKNVGNGYNIILFSSIQEAENCKIALQNPLLRFTIYKNQDDQAMTIKKCYKYIPNIDWSDDRVRTDEGLLEVCGCPNDKIKEYAKYCKEIIKKVDNGERP